MTKPLGHAANPTEAGAELHVSTPVTPVISDSKELAREASRARSNANLQMFKPGQSGNPGGRRKKLITEIYEEVAVEDRSKIKKRVQDILLSDRDVMLLKEMADRLEGKVEHADGSEREPLSVNIGIEILGNLAAK